MSTTTSSPPPVRRPARKEDREPTWLFAHSKWDALLILVAFGQFAMLVAGTLSVGSIAWWHSLLIALTCVFLKCTNYQCVAHNFLHNPFFHSKRLNQAFSVFNSILIGGPQTLYRYHHLHHHRHNNDLPNPETGDTMDYTSTWRFGRPPEAEENIIKYALLGYFRTDFGALFGEAKRRGTIRQVMVESAVFLGTVAVLAVLNPWGALTFLLPVWFFGNACSHAENYLEHYGATPGDRRTDSVSSYGRLYNLIWFNNGYHQEHHFKPQVHWTQVQDLREELPPEDQRRVVTGAHWFNFGPRKALTDDQKNLTPAAAIGRGDAA